MKGYVFCFFNENEKTMARPLFPYCCDNNRRKSLCLSCVELSKTQI